MKLLKKNLKEEKCLTVESQGAVNISKLGSRRPYGGGRLRTAEWVKRDGGQRVHVMVEVPGRS